MNDDWRLRIDLHDSGFAERLSRHLEAEEVEHDLERTFAEKVVVSVSEGEVFCYAASRAQLERAEQLIRRIAADHEWQLDLELSHWHAVAERWENPDEAEPAGPADLAEERSERVADERQESSEQGYPDFEIRIDCGSRSRAGELADRLRDEGIPNIHRHNYVLVGVADEDSGDTLLTRLRSELGPGTPLTLERNRRAVWETLPRSAFSVLGGLGG